VLGLIAGRPGIVSTVLAEAIGWERQDFKLHVRRVKELGLTRQRADLRSNWLSYDLLGDA
jgi:hypothetical protein